MSNASAPQGTVAHAASVLAASNIEVGNHLTKWGLNLDTIWTTVIAGSIVCVLGVLVARRATSGVPGKSQLIWETIVTQTERQVEQSIGVRVAPFVVPLAMALFLFILVSNWLEIIPGHGALEAPTADVNVPFALAILVIVWVHVWGAKRSGIRHYFAHFFKPLPLSPINIIEELVKPVTLALRLFGNMFAGALMLTLIGIFPFYILWAPNVVWKLFDMGIGAIQAFIFFLLTILYFSFASLSPPGEAARASAGAAPGSGEEAEAR